MYCITENKRGVLSLNWHLPIHPRALSKGSLCFTQEDIPCTANVNWFPAIVMSPCSSKSRDPDGANIWEEHCLIWFWGSLWVACIRVWEEGYTCTAMPRINIRVYEHVYTGRRVYTCIYTSIHTCRGTRHRASTDVTPQLPSDLLLPNLGSALPLNHLHTSLVTAPAFIAAITEICELDRAPTIGRVSRFILHYLPLVLSEGSVPKEEEDTYSKSKVSSGSNKFEPSELLPFKMHERQIKVRHFHWILLSLRPQLFAIPWTCKCHFYFWFALCLCRCLLGTHWQCNLGAVLDIQNIQGVFLLVPPLKVLSTKKLI